MATKNKFGQAEFRWTGGSAPWVVRSAIADAMERGAKQVKRTMRRLINVPYPSASTPGEPPRKRTGNLRNEIDYWVDRRTLTAMVGPTVDAPYGLHLEFGTKNMKPRPFMLRSLLADSRKLMNIINRAATIAFNKHARTKGKR